MQHSSSLPGTNPSCPPTSQHGHLHPPALSQHGRRLPSSLITFHHTSPNRTSWLGVRFNQQVRTHAVLCSEPVDTSTITANNTTTLLSVENSECLAFSAFQCFLWQQFWCPFFRQALHTSMSILSAAQPRLDLSHEALPPGDHSGQGSAHQPCSPVSKFTGSTAQPVCSSCFILSAAENQIIWNTALTVSHRGPGPAKLHPAPSTHPPSGVKCPTQGIQKGTDDAPAGPSITPWAQVCQWRWVPDTTQEWAGCCRGLEERGRASALLLAAAGTQDGSEKWALNYSYLQLKKCLSLKTRICYWQALKTSTPSLSVKTKC